MKELCLDYTIMIQVNYSKESSAQHKDDPVDVEQQLMCGTRVLIWCSGTGMDYHCVLMHVDKSL